MSSHFNVGLNSALWNVQFVCRRLCRSAYGRWEKGGRRYKHCQRNYISKVLLCKSHNLKGSKKIKCNSQKLLIDNNIIHQTHFGGYSMLPIGMRVFQKLERLIDEELNAIDAQKISMTTLAPETLWQKTGRWKAVGNELFKLADRHKRSFCLSPTHEEVVTDLIANYPFLMETDLPIKLYQITRKFRDELHPKYALLRGREFEMKDLYTFDATEEGARDTYNSVCEAYKNIFDRLQMPFVKAMASTGSIGGSQSHEFHFEHSIGEDRVLVCERCGFSENSELKGMAQRCADTSCQKTLKQCIEVGHSFLLGTKYSEALNAVYSMKNNMKEKKFLQMGCYGLGVSRILQACVEVLCSSPECTQLRWPKLIAPYKFCLIPLKGDDQCSKVAKALYDELNSVHGLRGDLIIDDRGKNRHLAIKHAKNIGIPYLITIRDKALADFPLFEIIDTYKNDSKFLSKEQIIDFGKSLQTV